jgi:tRNA(Ile)-lysidine synthase TilS/MesJ
MLRGTGRKGLSSLKSTDTILRPLLHLSKSDILMYAHHNKLKWREDSTNQDTKYLRNNIRHNLLSGLTAADRQALRNRINHLAEINQEIDDILIGQLHIQPAINKLDRHWFIMLPHSVAKEVMAAWLRRAGLKFDRKLLEKLVAGTKTLAAGRSLSVSSKAKIKVTKDELALV